LGILKDIKDRETRFDLLKQSIRDGESPYISSLVLGVLYREHGEMGGDEVEEEDRLLKYSQLKELTSVWVTNVEETAETGDFLATSKLDVILGRWVEWSDSDKPQQWVEENTEDIDDLLLFLNQFIRQGRYSSMSRSGVESYFDPEWLEPFLDPSEVEKRLENLANDGLEDWQKQTVELFMKGKEFLDEGKTPATFHSGISVNEVSKRTPNQVLNSSMILAACTAYIQRAGCINW
jgi:hypothetical protein